MWLASFRQSSIQRAVLAYRMQNPIKERIAKLREEIAHGGKKLHGAAGVQERRLQRLQESLDELLALTDWKKP